MTKREESPKDSMAATRRTVIAGMSAGIGSLALGTEHAAGAASQEISRSAEAIHQEVVLQADPARVYTALTDAVQFQDVTLLSAAVKSRMVDAAKPTEIQREAGGVFSLFGGHITGRIVELIANERIVQAWRAGDWAAGVYSIARFVLVKEGDGTRLVFDHTGFPMGQAEHLAAGWRENYWGPLAKFLASKR